MTDIIPYFAAFITILFGIGFILAFTAMDKDKS